MYYILYTTPNKNMSICLYMSLGYLKRVKATQKGEKWKQGCDVTGDRTQDQVLRD